MSKKNMAVDVSVAPQVYNVFRPKAGTLTVNGPAKFAIVDGSLVVSDAAGDVRYILGPGQWTNVNISPA